MEKKQPIAKGNEEASLASLTPEQRRELEAKKKLARPPKDKTEVTIGPSDKQGPDVLLE
jgi:hypothetical protein